MKVTELSKKLIAFCTKINASFSMNDKPLTLEQVFDPSGALPLLARGANQISNLCLDYGIGVNVEEAEGTMFGFKATFDEDTPDSLRLLFLIDTIYELISASPSEISGMTALDCLLYD